MLLHSVSVKNFKLLENVTINFSTDPHKPLTVIRGENASGKTSLLKAMLWGFYGVEGLDKEDQKARFTSTKTPAGETVTARVTFEFEHAADRYGVIRTREETSQGKDSFKKRPERVAVYRLTDAGAKEDVDPEGFIGKVIPRHYKDIFFTNGDAVQQFMSASSASRKTLVAQAVKALLGLDNLFDAEKDIKAAVGRCHDALTQDGGSDLNEARVKWKLLTDQHAQVEQKHEEVDGELGRIRNHLKQWEEQLSSLNRYGDLNKINGDLNAIQLELEDDEKTREEVLERLRKHLESKELSWAVTPSALDGGMNVLQELHDRGVIPGTAVEVLKDRLIDEVCFCGTSLDEGSKARQLVETKIDEHKNTDSTRELLTSAYHSARSQKEDYDAEVEAGDHIAAAYKKTLAKCAKVGDRIRQHRDRQDVLKDKRKRIDADEVASLTSRIDRAEKDILERVEAQGDRQGELRRLSTQVEEAEKSYEKLQRNAGLSEARKAELNVSKDLQEIIKEAIRSLKEDRVQEVAAKMSEHFFKIVGCDPNIDAAIFGSVTITQKFDIEVRTPTGYLLDFDSEINSASQRALTLSFIWALTEVAKVESPRIIDSPLGMVAGAVKSRLTELITTPSEVDGVDYQVVLFLTPSEIRDIEEILDNRAGTSYTLTCSQHVNDLKFPWGHDRSRSRVCTCSHRQSCRICARTYDEEYGFKHRNYEATDENDE